MNTNDLIREELRKWAHLNDGAGLIVTPQLGERLKRLGIDGPYTVQPHLPEDGTETARYRK